jgi:HK97 family phage major capsid protein
MAGDKKPFPLRAGETLGDMRFAEFPALGRPRAVKPEERERAARVDSAGRKLFEIAISSETEVERWYGIEILGHGKGEIDFTRLDNGANLLMDHSPRDVVGVLEPGSQRVEAGVLRADARFSRSARAAEVQNDVEDDIRLNTSVGYFIRDWEVTQRVVGKDEKGRPLTIDVYRITLWEPAEVSLVAIPADVTVGVGRSSTGAVAPAEDAGAAGNQEARNMTEEEIRAKAEADAKAAADARAAEAAAASQREQAARATAVVDIANRSKEAGEILRMAQNNGLADRAAAWIEEGKTADQVARMILDERKTKAAAQPAAENIGNRMDEKSRRRFSYQRAIRLGAGVAARERPDGEGAEDFAREKFDGIEAEVHKQLMRDRAASGLAYKGGVLVPMDLRTDDERWQDWERRTLDSKTATKGTETVFERPGEMIELLRVQAVLGRLGARFMGGLSGPVSFVKQTGGLSVFWVGENPAVDVTASDVAFGLVNMVPKTLQATTAYSRQLLVQSSLDIESMIREEFSLAHALKLDESAIYGLGANGEPQGIYLAPDVNVRPVGGVPDLDDVVQTTVLIAEDNALMGNLGWVTTPALAGKMRTTLEISGVAPSSSTLWQGTLLEGTVGGYRSFASNQMSKVMTGSAKTGGAESGAVFGNWSDLIVGLFQSMELIVDPYAQKKRGLIEVTSFQMADIVLRHGESFAKWTGATII